MKHNIMITTAATAIVCLLGVGTASAAPKPNVFDNGNKWVFLGFDDTSPKQHFVGYTEICFFPYHRAGTNIQGFWVDVKIPGHWGKYSQEGDRVAMHGDFNIFRGHSSFQFEINSWDMGSGHATLWRNFGLTDLFATLLPIRRGNCYQQTDLFTPEELAERIEPVLKADGVVADTPILDTPNLPDINLDINVPNTNIVIRKAPDGTMDVDIPDANLDTLDAEEGPDGILAPDTETEALDAPSVR